jgi:FtsP/CotA-like multicopper oxidase with cupredoxin domain
MRSRIPEPMPTEKLLKYRWKTPLVLDDIVTRRVDPNTAAAPLQMYIGETTHPYKFAAAQGRGLPALRPKGGKAWGYGLTPQDIRYPGPTLVATANVAPWTGGVWVQWTNLLPAGVAHPFVMPPSDARAGSMGGRYAPGHATVHLHGGHMPWTSDGHPVRRDGKASVLSPKSAHGTEHSVLFEYHNTQRGGATLWYHDHTMDATATNVYAGLAGGYLLRDPAEDACAALPTGDFEVPLIIQDRSFDVHGVQLYGDARHFGCPRGGAAAWSCGGPAGGAAGAGVQGRGAVRQRQGLAHAGR